MTKLYIIGNGFDLAHELPTSYNKNLKPILEKNDKELFDLVNNLYFVLNSNSQDDYWFEFEKHIGEITDIEQHKFMDFLKKQTDDFYENTELPSVTNFSFDPDDDNYGDIYTETERAISAISDMNPNFDYKSWDNLDKIRSFIDLGFKQMIEKANLDLINKEKLDSINFQSSDFFINFNYTNTLETVYGISPDHILHIHGDLERGLILGNTKSTIDQFCMKTKKNINALELNNPDNPFLQDTEEIIIKNFNEGRISAKAAAEELAMFRDEWQDLLMHEFYAESNVSSGIKDKIINNISELGVSFIKNIELAKLEDWLKKNNLKESGITEIITLGHSLGIVDKDYFEFINSEIKPEKWYVSKHDDDDPSIENAKTFSFANMITMFLF
ncbi:AbiH family protein [Enterococcus hirae]|uniref:AbiH family protein n=1 Tax=Enterococcus hirae TaxID=1354 RepID=UPI00313B2C79